MPFTEDLSVFFNPNEFGTSAIYTGASAMGMVVDGIFEAAYLEPMGNTVEGAAPVFTCSYLSVQGVVQGDTLIIGGDTYVIRGVEPDYPIVLLRLEKQ